MHLSSEAICRLILISKSVRTEWKSALCKMTKGRVGRETGEKWRALGGAAPDGWKKRIISAYADLHMKAQPALKHKHQVIFCAGFSE